MSSLVLLKFDQVEMYRHIDSLDDGELDALDFGVIAFDGETAVRRYNACESNMAGLAPGKVLGFALFTTVAPCMNNFMVSQRFEDAASSGTALDATIDYVFTLRMRPSKVSLRLLSSPGRPLRYILVNRRT